MNQQTKVAPQTLPLALFVVVGAADLLGVTFFLRVPPFGPLFLGVIFFFFGVAPIFFGIFTTCFDVGLPTFLGVGVFGEAFLEAVFTPSLIVGTAAQVHRTLIPLPHTFKLACQKR